MHETTRVVPPTEEEILKFFSSQWKPEIYEDPQEETIAFSRGIKMLKDYYAKNYPTKFNVADLEARFEVPILDKDEVHTITGIIDRIDHLEEGIFEVIDYKTGKKMPAQKYVDRNLQLAVYHLGITNRWPFILEQEKPVKLSLYYLIHGEKLSIIKTPEHLTETKEKILLIIDRVKNSITNEKFDPNPGPLCDWCQFQPHCPLFKHKFKEKTPDDQEIKKIIDEYLELKIKSDETSKKMAELKILINRYYDKNNVERVFADSGYITRAPKKIFTYDGKALKAILEPLGKWQEILTVDTTILRKIIDSLPVNVKRKIEAIKRLDKETKTISITRDKFKTQNNK